MQPINPVNPGKVTQVQAPQSSTQVVPGGQHDLAAHQTVKATVTEGGQERVKLEFNGEEVEAKTRTPLKAGQDLLLLPFVKDGKLLLKIMGLDIDAVLLKHLRSIRHKLDPSPLEEAIKNKPELSALTGMMKGNIEIKPSLLAHLPRILGLQHEANILHNQDSENLKKLALFNLQENPEEALDVLREIEMWQLITAKLSALNHTAFPLPFNFIQRGYYFSGAPYLDEDGATQTSHCVHLDLLEHGSLEATFILSSSALNMKILCSDKVFAEKLKSALDIFKDRLGFIESVNIYVAHGKVKDTATALIGRLALHERRLLDEHL